jgi:nitroreductase
MTMPTDSRPYVPVARPISTRSIAEALHRAVSAARYAPSAGNAQPWRWRLDDDGLDLFIDSSRMSDDQLAVVGCGAALQHARLALAALGWRATVARVPDAADPHYLARLHIDAVARIGRRAVQAAQNVRLRHTDPRPVTGRPLGAHDLEPLTAAVEAEGSRLHVLRADEILRLLAASPPAADLGQLEAQWYEELARWAGRGSMAGEATGERAATFIVLHGHGDDR